MPVAVTRYTVSAPHAPRARVAILADLHACAPFMDVPRIQEIVAQCNDLGADMICLLGDYVGHALGARRLAPAPVAAELASLRAPLGVWAVFGNHDWQDDRDAVQRKTPDTHWHRALADAGIGILSNDVHPLEASGVAFNLAGLESQRAFMTRWNTEGGADDLDAVLSKVQPDQFTLLLAHEPDVFPDLPPHIGLTLCGHMHAGQVRLFGRAITAPSRYGTRYAYGHFSDGTKQMIVSGGLGLSVLPIRFGAPPELNLIEIAPCDP